ncbi:hypothetical protein TcasGA2_TC008694 [Tribolium castaneum]|uniref:Uncharacterized protein n=1 Tax=Tribolium castaneum TaxID=7070 RepID=D6WSQ4_TRICA|nr:hypothetical protein TcasGA2_TC008694 [Tribolium castaneum]
MSCSKDHNRESSVQMDALLRDFGPCSSPLAWASGLAIRENEPGLERTRSDEPSAAKPLRKEPNESGDTVFRAKEGQALNFSLAVAQRY